jgi:hypothetical protein
MTHNNIILPPYMHSIVHGCFFQRLLLAWIYESRLESFHQGLSARPKIVPNQIRPPGSGVGVRPSSGAATTERRLARISQVRLECSRCCARGRAHSGRTVAAPGGSFKQALSLNNSVKRERVCSPKILPNQIRPPDVSPYEPIGGADCRSMEMIQLEPPARA